MKKLVTIALLCAMLLSCFASCATMQAGELDVAAYADEAGAQNVEFKTELDEGLEPWDGSAVDKSWYENDKTKTEYEISTAAQFKGLRELQNSKVTFEGVTIKLTSDIDLGGKKWQSPSSGNAFKGTFDGQGHAIGNFYMSVTSSAVQSLFGSLGGNAVVKNVSVVDATFTNALTANKSQLSPVTSRVITEEGKTVTISNVYAEAEFVMSQTKYTLAKAGAIASHIEGKGSVVIENCENASTITTNGANTAGIVGTVGSDVKNVTIKGCVFSGTINNTAGNKNAGIISETGTMAGKLTIEDCVVSGDVITKNTQAGGILGVPGTIKGGLVIKNCTVSGKVEGTTMSGGLVGYIAKSMDIAIANCKVTGSVTGQRTTGGLIGTLNSNGKYVTINDCEVTASLNLTLHDAKNNNGGGLIGKLDNATSVMIQNCRVDSVMKATYAPKEPLVKEDGTQDGDIVSGAAGLIGRIHAGSKAYISDSSVGGNFEFIYAGDDYANVAGEPLVFVTGRFVGSINDDAAVYYRENNSVDSNLIIKHTGAAADFVIDGEGSVPSILTIGYQTKVNDNNTYDLRYIFAAKDYFDGLGVRANIRFVDANGVFDEKNNNIYVDTVYSYVADDEGNLYAAEDYGYDYLYTLVVKGVPAEYAFDANNLQVILKPFGATKVGEGVVLTESGLIDQGKSLGNTSAANMNITLSNMSTTLDDKFVAEDAIYIDGHAFDTNVSYGVHTGVKASAAECTGGYADGTLEIPAHVYLDHAIVGGNDFQFMNITYNFKVTEAGWYDLSIYMRMKGNDLVDKGDCDGSYKRGYLMMFDWAGGEQAYDLLMNFDKVADIKTDSAGTYLNGLKVYLEAGEHTITFKGDEGYINSFPHIRGIYLAKAD